jgi:hypothetical protein
MEFVFFFFVEERRPPLWSSGQSSWPQSRDVLRFFEVEVTLRPIVSWSVSLGVRLPSGTRDQFYFHLEIFFRQLRVCNFFVAPSLTRGRVCNLLNNYFWALPEKSLLGRSPAELTAIFYSHLRLPQPGGPGPRIYIPQEEGGSVILPGTGFPFLSPLTTRRAAVEVF